ncbi:hypothetical protein [Sphingomonas adhaesiva]|uniref:hypothetical protein n=1 Tax=Sphingomonas adhaesiva TaxID=28212 RepID=UPI002FF6A078
MLFRPLTGLRLLLPAIVPSWRFFDAVGDSPRIDYALLAAPDGDTMDWIEVRSRPATASPGAMLRRLVWNAEWNEALFLTSLAERLLTSDDPRTVAHSERELLLRVARRCTADPSAWLRLRIRLVRRDDERVVHVSDACRLADLMVR